MYIDYMYMYNDQSTNYSLSEVFKYRNQLGFLQDVGGQTTWDNRVGPKKLMVNKSAQVCGVLCSLHQSSLLF